MEGQPRSSQRSGPLVLGFGPTEGSYRVRVPFTSTPDLCPVHTLPQGAAIWLPASAGAQEKGSKQWRRGPCGLLCPLSIKAPAKGRGQKQPRGASEQMEQVDQAVGIIKMTDESVSSEIRHY